MKIARLRRLSAAAVALLGLGLSTVGDLRQAMLARHGRLGSVEADDQSTTVPPPSDGSPVAPVVGVVTVLVGVVVVAAAAVIARRRRSRAS